MSVVPSTVGAESFLEYQGPSTVRQASVEYTEPGPNVVAQIIKSGAPKPHATVSNNMVARVDSYSPPPGVNLAHYMALDVDKAHESPTTVVDAIQRYFNVRPRREPLADPLDIASTDSYPSLIMEERSNYRNMKPYRYSINGTQRDTDISSFYADSGHMKVRIVGTGITTIKTPATQAEEPIKYGAVDLDSFYYPPAYAAQMAMNKISYLMDPSRKMQTISVGPAMGLGAGVNGTMAAVANSLAPLRDTTASSSYSTAPRLDASVVSLSMV
ncbi:MAG: hypothetical protein LBF40_02300 [Deltaproteobacteria bacterium]|jgi:hypothetical protein|nr:hypothetical protein [Deltaproteobacteria bacterium]